MDGLPGTDDAGTLVDERLLEFASSKYDLIDEVIAISTITRRFAKKLGRCFDSSRRDFNRARYTNATIQLDVCNDLVRGNLGAFTSTPSSPNPSGELIGRTANLFLTIDVRLNNGTARVNWPSAPLP